MEESRICGLTVAAAVAARARMVNVFFMVTVVRCTEKGETIVGLVYLHSDCGVYIVKVSECF